MIKIKPVLKLNCEDDCKDMPITFDIYEDLLVIFHFGLMGLPQEELQGELDRLREGDAHWDDLCFT